MEEKSKETRIMIFGTFDGVHKGHLNLFKQAQKLAVRKNGAAKKPYVIASIARDRNVFKIKGAKPDNNEKKRMQLVKKTGKIDKVVLGGLKNHLPHILRERPDIIALGYDQKNYIKNLKGQLKECGLSVKIVRLKPYKEKIYKNSIIKTKR